MKKVTLYFILVGLGIVSPELVDYFRCRDLQDFPDIFQERDDVRIQFLENPSRKNIEKIWEALYYQGCNNKDKYDLFPYEWYIAFNDSDYIAINTVHRMLTDTIYDEEHYVANASMIEFAGKIEFCSQSVRHFAELAPTENH